MPAPDLSAYTDAELRAELARRANERRASASLRALLPAIREVESRLGVPYGSVTLRRTTRHAVRARQAVMAALLDLGWTYSAVARLLGYDHTTVCHAGRAADAGDVAVARDALGRAA